jgi:hypothetical protein
VQVVAPFSELYVPDGHRVQTPFFTYLPVGQMVHDDEPVFAVYPVAQLWQADASMLPVLLLNVLAGHAEQELVPEL